jgi:hypothetical protein
MESNISLVQNGFLDLFLDISTAQKEQSQNPYFIITQLRERPFRMLSSAACKTLETELHKAISNETFVNIPTTSLMKIQGTCIDSMRTIELVQEFETCANEYLAFIVDILSSTRIALLMISLKPEALAIHSEDTLQLSLRILSSILFETQNAASLVSKTEASDEAARTLRAFNRLVTKVDLSVVLPGLEELIMRIIHPSYRDLISGGLDQDISTLIDSAVELTASIFLYHSEERRSLIAAIVSIAMADAGARQGCHAKSKRKESMRTSSVLFTNFVHLYTLSSKTGDFVNPGNAPLQHDHTHLGAQSTTRRHTTREEMRERLEAAERCAQQIISSLFEIDQIRNPDNLLCECFAEI